MRRGAPIFAVPLSVADIRWAFSGVRPLYRGDDSATSMREASRDYFIARNAADAPPLLTIYGGKLTTFRRLAEAVLDKLGDDFPRMQAAWTADSALPGAADSLEVTATLRRDFPFLPPELATRYAANYGSEAANIITGATEITDLGNHFGAGLYAVEVDYLRRQEWATCADDILWRRTKLGLQLTPPQVAELEKYITESAA